VPRGTRPKKPSSSRGFAREARGAQGSGGSWGLKTKNQIFFSFLFKTATTTKKYIYLFIYLFFILFFLHPRPQGGGEAREGGGEEGRNECVHADGKNPSAGKTASTG
jgi:hypothetical protein